jgi:PAS domain S-box-containing protein
MTDQFTNKQAYGLPIVEVDTPYNCSILNMLPDVVVLLYADLRVIHVNSSFVDLFGFHESELKGTFFRRYLTDDSSRVLMQRYTERFTGIFSEADLEIINRYGEAVSVWVKFSGIYDENRLLKGIILSIRDVSEKNYEEKTIIDKFSTERMQDKLKKKKKQM